MNSILPDSTPLRMVVRQAAAEHAPISDAEIENLARRMNVAGVATGGGGVRLLSTLLDPALDLGALVARISADQGLSIRVLRVANSPFYGHSGGVADLNRATQVLGLTALRGIAAAACFDSLTRPKPGAVGTDLTAFRDHSLATACAAQSLAERFAPALAPEAFMAGILHDLGLLVRWRLRPESGIGPQAGDTATPDTPGQASAHAHYGQRLLSAWNLPAALVQAVAEHDRIPDGSHIDTDSDTDGDTDAAATGTAWTLPRLLNLADRLASAAGCALPGDAQAAPVPTEGPLAGVCGAIARTLPGDLQRLLAAFND